VLNFSSAVTSGLQHRGLRQLSPRDLAQDLRPWAPYTDFTDFTEDTRGLTPFGSVLWRPPSAELLAQTQKGPDPERESEPFLFSSPIDD